MPPLQLTRADPRVHTSSSFQTFLLDRLRQENIKKERQNNPGLGWGMLEEFTDDETPMKLEDWLNEHLNEYDSFVLNSV